MAKYLISFPASAMVVPASELPAVVASSHAVVAEAKRAGVWVFGGGIDADIAPLLVDGDGRIDASAAMTRLDGGFTVIDVDSPATAQDWAARFARGCHCPQELRAFGDDAQSR